MFIAILDVCRGILLLTTWCRPLCGRFGVDITPSATGMKELLCACKVYSLEHAVIYNSKKSTALVCRNMAMGHAVRPSFIVNGDVIPESEKVKYLWHIIGLCSDLSDDADMMWGRGVIYRPSMLKEMSYLELFICVRSLLKILYSVPCTLSPVVELYGTELS